MILLINKPKGMTSHDVVAKVRKIYNTRQVGHTGTLDPFAEGVMVLLVGRDVKASEYITAHRKTYRAVMKLGATTDTGDVTGNVTSKSDEIPSFDEILAVLPEFRGKIKQIPPMYSALKVNGVKLCDAARRGEVIEREAREIEIFGLEAERTDNNGEIILNIDCSSGTYVRTLCEDIGSRLGCGAFCLELCRTSVGDFRIDECVGVAALSEMTEEERKAYERPVETVFADLRKIALNEFFSTLCKNGCEIYLKKIGADFRAENELVLLYDFQNTFFGIGKISLYPDGPAVKAVKRL